jgi:hypothetical protein
MLFIHAMIASHSPQPADKWADRGRIRPAVRMAVIQRSTRIPLNRPMKTIAFPTPNATLHP